jgi:hypothetical protein
LPPPGVPSSTSSPQAALSVAERQNNAVNFKICRIGETSEQSKDLCNEYLRTPAAGRVQCRLDGSAITRRQSR